jgi:hypothetical protein
MWGSAMGLEWRLQIHFHTQDQASVILEGNAVQERQQVLGELALFSCFVCRELVNLGGDRVAGAIANAFTQLAGELNTIAYHDSPGGALLVAYKGQPGEKQFVSSLREAGQGFNFSSDARGFGWLSRGYGYYSPQAMMILLKYLAKQHIKDFDYIMKLETVAEQCGVAYLKGQLGITTSLQVGIAVALHAMKLGEKQV